MLWTVSSSGRPASTLRLTIPWELARVHCRVGDVVPVPAKIDTQAGTSCIVAVHPEGEALLVHPSEISVTILDTAAPTVVTFDLLATQRTSKPVLVRVDARAAGGLRGRAEFTVEVSP